MTISRCSLMIRLKIHSTVGDIKKMNALIFTFLLSYKIPPQNWRFTVHLVLPLQWPPRRPSVGRVQLEFEWTDGYVDKKVLRLACRIYMIMN